MTHLPETSMSSSRGRYDQLPKKILKVFSDLEYKEGDASIASRKRNESRYYPMNDFRDESDENFCFSEFNCKDRFPELRDRQRIRKFSGTKIIDPSFNDSLSFSSLHSKSTTSSDSTQSLTKNIDSRKYETNLQRESKIIAQENSNKKSDLHLSSRAKTSYLKSSMQRKKRYSEKKSCDCISPRENRRIELDRKCSTDNNPIELNLSIDSRSTLSLVSSSSRKSSVTTQIKEIQSGRHRKIAKGIYAAVQILIKSNTSKEYYSMAEQELENVLSSFNIIFDRSLIQQSIRAAMLVIETVRSTKIDGSEVIMTGLSPDHWKELVTGSIYLARNERLRSRLEKQESRTKDIDFIFLRDCISSDTSDYSTMLYAAIDAALVILLEANTEMRFTRKFPSKHHTSPRLNLFKSVKLSPMGNNIQITTPESSKQSVNTKQKYSIPFYNDNKSLKKKTMNSFLNKEKFIKKNITKELREKYLARNVTKSLSKKKTILKTISANDQPYEGDYLKLHLCGLNNTPLHHDADGTNLNDKFDNMKEYLNVSMNRLSSYFGESKIVKMKKKRAPSPTTKTCTYLNSETKEPSNTKSSQTHIPKPILKKNGINRAFFERKLSSKKKIEIIKAHMDTNDMEEERPYFAMTVSRKRHKFDANETPTEKNCLGSSRKMKHNVDFKGRGEEPSNQKFPRASVHRLSSKFLSKVAGDEIEIILLNT